MTEEEQPTSGLETDTKSIAFFGGSGFLAGIITCFIVMNLLGWVTIA